MAPILSRPAAPPGIGGSWLWALSGLTRQWRGSFAWSRELIATRTARLAGLICVGGCLPRDSVCPQLQGFNRKTNTQQLTVESPLRVLIVLVVRPVIARECRSVRSFGLLGALDQRSASEHRLAPVGTCMFRRLRAFNHRKRSSWGVSPGTNYSPWPFWLKALHVLVLGGSPQSSPPLTRLAHVAGLS